MILGKKRLGVSRKMAEKVWKNPGRALEIGAKVGTAFVSRSPNAALSSLLEVIIFYPLGKEITWAILHTLCYITGTKKQTD